MSNFCPNKIGARNVENLTNVQILIFVGISCSFKLLKHRFYHYSNFIVDNRHTWRWYSWKTIYLWEERVRSAEVLTNKCPKIWRLTDRFPNRSIFFWTQKFRGPIDITSWDQLYKRAREGCRFQISRTAGPIAFKFSTTIGTGKL